MKQQAQGAAETSAVWPDPFDGIPQRSVVDALVALDDDGRITGWNDGAEALFGWCDAELLGRSYACLFLPEDRDRELPASQLAEVRSDGFGTRLGFFRRKNGSRVLANCIMLSHATGTAFGFIEIPQDHAGPDAVAPAPYQNVEQLRLLIETIPQLVWRSLDDGNWDWAGPQWVAYTGQAEIDSHGHGWKAMVHPDDQAATMQAWHAAADRGGLDVEHRLRRADGVYRWFQTRAVPLQGRGAGNGRSHWFGTSTDVDNLRQAEQRIHFLAYHDTLTGAANRALLEQVLEQRTTGDPDTDASCIVLYLDLDGFKAVNDQLGHRGGDELLRQVVARLRTALRSDGIVARTGGDEFVLVQPSDDPNEADRLATLVAEVLSEPFLVLDQPLRISASIGLALHPRDGDSPEELLRRADLALYRAKAAGGHTVRVFEPAMEAELRQRQTLERDLDLAIACGQLEIHYQPVFWTATGRLCGFEALARWTHPQDGPISPGVFIPLAEECGLIVRLGAVVLEAACRTAASWDNDHPIAVNLSPAQVRTGDLARQIAGVLARTGLEARRLELEVTEGLLMDDSPHVLHMLQSIKALGVRIALDDFGTGYSSLGYLCRFPFDKVKIDQSFIRGLAGDPGARAVVRAVTALGHSLHLEVTAEGVETELQLALLREIGCDQVQGYLLGRPAPAHAAGTVTDRMQPPPS